MIFLELLSKENHLPGESILEYPSFKTYHSSEQESKNDTFIFS